jgi:hypothetical protein
MTIGEIDWDAWQERATEATKATERLRETAIEAAARVEQLGWEFTRTLLRPHEVQLGRDGVWECGRCFAASADPEIIRELGGCGSDGRD